MQVHQVIAHLATLKNITLLSPKTARLALLDSTVIP